MSDVLGMFKSEADAERATEMDVEWWESHLLEKRRERLRYGIEMYKREGGECLRTPPKLVLGTIHSVKGGEADSVYVWPDLSRQGYVTGWGIERGPHRDPTIRLFYVAFTRAKHKLTIMPRSGQYAAKLPTPKGEAVT